MTPAARYQAAIEIVDVILTGQFAELVLTNWARRNRFAGSKDRAAIRDIVFEAERNRRSCGYLGGSLTGRGIILGWLRQNQIDPASVFLGEKYSPKALEPHEEQAQSPLDQAPDGVRFDLPDWIVEPLKASLGPDFEAAALALRSRAPVFLRVNLRHKTRQEVQQALEAEGVQTRPGLASETCLEVTGNPRRVKTTQAFLNGWIELQDASSQAAMARLDLTKASRILDFCAGGGGKSLALADRSDAQVFAHDVDQSRMTDIASRAARAGVAITVLERSDIATHAPFDLVLLDAPCSGSGTWRRAPSAKWSLTPEGLAGLCKTQSSIMKEAQDFVAPDGVLAYATCSLLKSENEDQVARFLAENIDWRLVHEERFLPGAHGDGFYIATLARK